MKLIRADKDQHVFHLGKKEKQLLLAVLDRYPLIPSAHQPLTQSVASGQAETDQRLLDEALAELRRENKRQLQSLLSDPRRWHDTETGCRVTLSSADVEWLLQVLNDVRVGSWIILGAPEKDLWDFKLDKETAPHAWAMEAAGIFQTDLLAALQRGNAT